MDAPDSTVSKSRNALAEVHAGRGGAEWSELGVEDMRRNRMTPEHRCGADLLDKNVFMTCRGVASG